MINSGSTNITQTISKIEPASDETAPLGLAQSDSNLEDLIEVPSEEH